MPDLGEWDAVVLAGGRSSRLGGVDKAGMLFDGETLLARTLDALPGAARLIIVGDVDVRGAIVVQEEPRFGGPAAAIGAGLARVTSPHVVIVACDQPFVAEAVGPLLAAAVSDGAIAVSDGRRQNLMLVLDAAALRAVVAMQPVLTDLSVRALLAPLHLVEVEVPERSALDIDTWHDRDMAQEALHD